MTPDNSPKPENPTGDLPPKTTAPVRGGLRAHERLALALTALFVGGPAFSCLPPSICRGDFGDLQLAAWKLGIAHPPGYVIYALLLHPFTWLPGVDPAFAVSVGCLIAGILALLLCAWLQIRLGINAWIAAATVVGLSLYPRVQLNLIAPEVYGPTLLFLVLSAYLSVRYVQTPRERTLWSAALTYGVAVVSRPPLALTLPFVFLALRSAARTSPVLRGARAWVTLLAVAAIPLFTSLAYVLLRDRADIAYNYVEGFNIERGVLPHPDDGLGAKLHRALWLMSGRQFNEYLGVPLKELPKKIVWLRREIVSQSLIAFFGVMAVAVVGAMATFRRSPVAALLLSGMVFQSVVYALIYRVHGQAADLLPLLFALAVFCGAAASAVVERLRARAKLIAGFSLFVLPAVVASIESHVCRPDFLDGAKLVEEVDMPTMPQRALIVTEWDTAAPLRYARLISHRADITVLTVHPSGWRDVPEQHPNRIIYITHVLDELKGDYQMLPFRNLWRLSKRE